MDEAEKRKSRKSRKSDQHNKSTSNKKSKVEVSEKRPSERRRGRQRDRTLAGQSFSRTFSNERVSMTNTDIQQGLCSMLSELRDGDSFASTGEPEAEADVGITPASSCGIMTPRGELIRDHR